MSKNTKIEANESAAMSKAEKRRLAAAKRKNDAEIAKAQAELQAQEQAPVEEVVEQEAVEQEASVDPIAAAVAAHNAAQENKLPSADGIVRASTVVRPVKLVHAIAANMYEADKTVTRKDVISACVAQGIATHTARTQYQVWYTAQRNTDAAQAMRDAKIPNVNRTEPKLETSP